MYFIITFGGIIRLSFKLCDLLCVFFFFVQVCKPLESGLSMCVSSNPSHKVQSQSSLFGHSYYGHRIRAEPSIRGPEDLRGLMKKLSINNISNFELEEMFNEGHEYMKNCQIKCDHKKKVQPNSSVTFEFKLISVNINAIEPFRPKMLVYNVIMEYNNNLDRSVMEMIPAALMRTFQLPATLRFKIFLLPFLLLGATPFARNS